MKIEKLLQGIQNCDCKKEHSCPIDYVKIGKDALCFLVEICSEYKNILLVSDKNTYCACGEKVYTKLQEKIYKNLILENNGDIVIPNEEKITQIEKEVVAETDLIIGVGSGVINDLCKYVSFKCDLPYYIVATAPSMDGYASVGAALILEGMKVTLNARVPKAIIADTAVLKEAPMDMLCAGYGDIIGKYSCLNDWKLSALINGEYFCQRVYDLTFDMAERVKALSGGILQRDEETIGALMEALVAVGIAMSYVGNSRPASGSEHHLSHFFEITGILDNKEYFAHGIDVVYSSVITAKLREEIIKGAPRRHNFDEKEWEENIRRIYSSCADGVIKLQKDLGWYKMDNELLVKEKWEQIKQVLKEAPSKEEFIDMIKAVGLDFNEFEKLYGKDKINDAIFYAKDLKDRYSVLWLYYEFFKENK